MCQACDLSWRTFPKAYVCRTMTPVTQKEVTQEQIGARVAEEVERAGGVRQLARHLAGNGADKRAIDRWRRNVYRYLDGGQPNEESALEMSKRLRRPQDWFRATQKAKDRTVPERVKSLEREVEEIQKTLSRIERRLFGEGGERHP